MMEVITWLVSRFGLSAVSWAFSLGMLVSGGVCGWTINGWRWEARTQTREANIERDRAAIYEVARKLESLGDDLTRKTITLEAANRKLGKEKDDALRKATTGRACLGADLVRLLDDAAPAPTPGLRLPPPASGIAGADAAAARDQDATDTDVALWIRYAREQYDVCRGRIDALREFFNSDHD
jgi:hypothetical protein